MVFAEKWHPTPGNKREEELRKLKDKKTFESALERTRSWQKQIVFC
jgi:hypothetical protein